MGLFSKRTAAAPVNTDPHEALRTAGGDLPIWPSGIARVEAEHEAALNALVDRVRATSPTA